jgi:uncharacterized protein (UPF0335 family)
MGRMELLKRLEQVERQIAQDTELIASQRKVLADLSGKGVDNDAIQIMLVGLENLLVVHLQEREKLRGEIAKLDRSSQGPQPSDR